MAKRLSAEAPEASGFVVRATLRRAGGSLTMIVPAPARDALHLVEGQEMEIAVHDGRMIVEAAHKRAHYTLDELLAQCDADAVPSDEIQAWIDAPPVGREIW